MTKMNEENYLSSTQNISLLENLVCVKWKRKHDHTLFIGNEEREIHSISSSKNLVEDFIDSSCLARLEFYDIDFSDYPASFWERQGKKIKLLNLSHCILNVNTVSSIIKYCSNLDTFSIRVSDSFVETKNSAFSKVFEYLVGQEKRVMCSVSTLVIDIVRFNPEEPCLFDQTILNLLYMFPKFKNLTLKHNCDARNFSKYFPPISSCKELCKSVCWNNIFDLIKRKSLEMEELNIELSSPSQINCIWHLALDRRIALVEYRLTELTFEIAPVEKNFAQFKNYSMFLKYLRNLKTVTFKLLHQGCYIESQFLNKFLRDVIQKCNNLTHLTVECPQADVENTHHQWDMNFELLRDILSSNLTSLRINVDCCDVFLNSDKNELNVWWNDTIEFLSLSHICKKNDGRQHETMAAFLSNLQNLRHLHLSGDINDEVLKSIWIHQKKLKYLSLYIFNSSVISEAGLVLDETEMYEHFSEEVGDLSQNLEYLKINLLKKKNCSINKLNLPLNIFKKFAQFKKLRYISFRTSTDETELVIRLYEQLKHFQELKGLFLECNIKEMYIDFLYNTCRYCPCLERIYIKNIHMESKCFTIYEYKNFFRYCTSLKLLTHETGKSINRWFKETGKNLPERITEDDEIYLISTNANDMQSEFWFSSL